MRALRPYSGLLVCTLLFVPLGARCLLGTGIDYQVRQVRGVTGENCFECTLKQHPYAPHVRFRVQIRGARLQKDMLETLLRDADTLELRNVHERNYFRLEADLWVNGRRVGETKPAAVQASGGESRTRPAAAAGRTAVQVPAEPVGTGVPEAVSIGQLLERKADLSMLKADTEFGRAIEIICAATQPPLPVIVLWNDLKANALVDKSTPIGAEGFGVMKVGQALRIVLHAVSGGRLILHSEGGVAILGTRGMIEKHTTEVYPVTDLLAAPAFGGEDAVGTAGGGYR